MSRPRRRLPLIRVALMSALVGHWIANAIADPDEDAVVGLRYEGAALRPILIQTALVALAILAITLAQGFRRRPAHVDRTSIIALAVMLVALQTALFAATFPGRLAAEKTHRRHPADSDVRVVMSRRPALLRLAGQPLRAARSIPR